MVNINVATIKLGLSWGLVLKVWVVVGVSAFSLVVGYSGGGLLLLIIL